MKRILSLIVVLATSISSVNAITLQEALNGFEHLYGDSLKEINPCLVQEICQKMVEQTGTTDDNLIFMEGFKKFLEILVTNEFKASGLNSKEDFEFIEIIIGLATYALVQSIGKELWEECKFTDFKKGCFKDWTPLFISKLKQQYELKQHLRLLSIRRLEHYVNAHRRFPSKT